MAPLTTGQGSLDFFVKRLDKKTRGKTPEPGNEVWVNTLLFNNETVCASPS